MAMAVVGTVVGLIAFSASPAWAATGTGGGTGTWTYDSTATGGSLPCSRFDRMSYQSDAGYTGAFTIPPYVGPVEVTMLSEETFYGNPTGDLYSDPNCMLPLEGLIPITATIRGGPVNCPDLPGHYQRVGLDYVIAVNGQCTGDVVTTAVVFTGVYTGCRFGADGAPDSCTDVQAFDATGA